MHPTESARTTRSGCEDFPTRCRSKTCPNGSAPTTSKSGSNPRASFPRRCDGAAWTLYLSNVIASDRITGSLLEALRRSGHFDDALIVIVSDHGEEFGENNQVLHGGSLQPVLTQVPLLIKLPRSFEKIARASERTDRPSAPVRHVARGGRRSSTGRGSQFTAAQIAPSLWRSVDFVPLAEQYLLNGTNHAAIIDADESLERTTHFAESEPGYWDARRSEFDLLTPEDIVERYGVTVAEIYARQRHSWQESLPLQAASTDGSPPAGGPSKLDRYPWPRATTDQVGEAIAPQASSERASLESF